MPTTLHPRPALRSENGLDLPFQTWSFPSPRPTASTASVGGGSGMRDWVLNATVPLDYARTDLETHIADLARRAGLDGDGVGLLTAVDVRDHRTVHADGVTVTATVGVTDRLRADDRLPLPPLTAPGRGRGPGPIARPAPGTINIVVLLPVPLSPGALLNALTTATEAKVAALLDRDIAATGTPTDSVTVCAAETDAPGEPVLFTGAGSPWGARIARLVHHAVTTGVDAQRSAHP